MSITYDNSRLSGRIVEKFGTRANFYRSMCWSNTTGTKKLANEVKWSREDIIKACDVAHLDIKPKDIHLYFFMYEV